MNDRMAGEAPAIAFEDRLATPPCLAITGTCLADLRPPPACAPRILIAERPPRAASCHHTVTTIGQLRARDSIGRAGGVFDCADAAKCVLCLASDWPHVARFSVASRQ